MSKSLPSNRSKFPKQSLVTGMGLISPAGVGTAALWDATLKNQTLLKMNRQGFCVGEVDADLRSEIFKRCEARPILSRMRAMSPHLQVFEAHLFTIDAMYQAMEQAGWARLEPTDGFIYATTTGQIPIWENDLVRYYDQQITGDQLAQTFKHQTLGLTPQQIAAAADFHGPMQLVSSACSASTQALALAHWWIKSGKVKRCLVGGTELLCNLTIKGFNCLQLLSQEIPSPFDVKRRGINLSEGAAFLCLEADASDDRILARISGAGVSADAYHMTAPEPTGQGNRAAMQEALADAGLSPAAIDWMHAHGTGSVHNDLAEAAAASALFGEDMILSSTKAIHGHPLAIAGVLESILTVYALREGVRLGTHHCREVDPAIKVQIARDHERCKLRHVLKNTLGFGGVNGSIVYSHADEVL